MTSLASSLLELSHWVEVNSASRILSFILRRSTCPAPFSPSSVEFCQQLIAATGVALSPGSGFGKAGEGYVRFALVKDPETLAEAVAKIGSFLHRSS